MQWSFAVAAAVIAAAAAPPISAQFHDVPEGEWHYWGRDAQNTRYAPLDQINRTNFSDLEVAWIWRGDNFGFEIDYGLRSTPVYAAGRLFTVAGHRRAVVSIDPDTGETLWMFREPHTTRHERSERFNYGRGVTYAEIDGQGVIYVVTPAFFLHALDATTGRPLEGFGKPVPLEGFGDTGTVDLLADLGHPFDPDFGIPNEIGNITNSHPPMVVDGVVVVPNAGPRSRYQTRDENVPGDILAYDARTGEHLWKFNVIPRPGEFGHETWESDAWSRVGNINSWPGMAADVERGIVYVPMDAVTNDVFAGVDPGDNLFANSLVALEVRTGERLWHFQTIRRDVWDWDIPLPPTLLDIDRDGEVIAAVILTTKQGFNYVFDRVTGEPVWPIEDRPVPQTLVPGEHTAPTQPFPTLPAAFEMQGLTEEDLIDFTPELREMALEIIQDFQISPSLFNPPLHRDNPYGFRAAVYCPGPGGGANITGGSVADPETAILYVPSVKSCGTRVLVPGHEMDEPRSVFTNGETVALWALGPGTGLGSVDGLPILKPPYGRITAIDMNTGEHLWWIPNGDTPERIVDHPRLQGIALENTGQPSDATAVVTRSLLIYGEGRSGLPRMHAVDKQTGERLGTVELPARTYTAPMTFMHEEKQYIVVAIGGGGHPGSLAALSLP